MRRASQAWLASARSQPPPLSTQVYTRIGARPAATILTCATGSARSASLLSTTRPTLRTAFTTTAASTTLRRLGLSGLTQPLRAGLRSKTLPGGRRRYSAEPGSETAKVAETPESLEALRAEFYKFQRRDLNWKIGGVQVPEAVLWLMFFQFLGLAFYTGWFERNASIKFVRQYVERLKSMGFPQGSDNDHPPSNVPGFTSVQTGWELTALHWAAFAASLSVIAFIWARLRTRENFREFVLSRALGETTGTYPITAESVVFTGDTIKLLDKGLKSVKRDVGRRAGFKAVLASVGLLLASTASSYAFTTWVDAKMKDGVIRFRRSDVLQGETALSLVLMFNFLVSWAVLVYQPYTILPFVISNILMSYLRFTDNTYRSVTLPKEVPEKPVVTEHKAVVEVDGGKEYITVTEKKSGSGYTKTETRVFVPDAQHTLDTTAKAEDDADTQRSLDTTTKTDA